MVNKKVSQSPLLPAHIAFTQGLTCTIHESLSHSSAQSLSVGQLCALSATDFTPLTEISLDYASLKGSVKLRSQISHFHQHLNQHEGQLDEKNVLTFCGAQEGLAAIYQLLLEENDEVVVVTPCYPSLSTMAEQRGAIVKSISLSAETDWQLSIDDFKQRVNQRTKLIVLNSPHNPSGSIIDSDLADEILALAQAFDCYLIADDVAQASNYHHLSLAHRFLDYEKALVVGVLSKSFGLSGIRVGWVVSRNLSLLNEILVIKSYGSICCSVVDEHLAIMAFEHKDEIIENTNRQILANIALFENFVEQHQSLVSWQSPQAGILALVEIKNVTKIEAWAQQVAEQTGILILPATLFGLTGNYFRLGLGKSNFEQTLNCFSVYLSEKY